MSEKKTVDVRLTQEEERLLEETIRKIDQAIPILHRLEACGEDCSARRDEMNKRRKQLAAIKEHFGQKGFDK